MGTFKQIADLLGAIMVEFTHKEKHQFSRSYFGVAWQQVKVFTLEQFLSVYRDEWVTYPSALKFYAL